MTHSRTSRRAAALVLAVGLGLSACGGDAEGDDVAAPTTAAEETSPTEEPAEQPAPAEEPAPADPTATEDAAESETVAVSAEDFSYTLDEDSFTAGEYTFELTNDGGASHDLVLERDGADVAATDIIGPGETATLTTELEPGEYVLYCSVGNHRAQGMEVTITVES